MNALASNKMRFLVIFSILIMISSVIPGWAALESDLIKDPKGSKSDDIMVNNKLQIENWCNLVGILDEPEFNQEQYYEQTIAEYGLELESKRTRNSKTYLGSDNQVTYRIYSGEIHYQTPTGTWQELDTEITKYNNKPIGTNTIYDHTCETNTIHTYFRMGYTMPDMVLTAVGDDQLAWEPLGMTFTENTGNEIEFNKPQNSKAIVRNNKILYPESYDNAADIFTVKDHELKHEIVLDSLPKLSNIQEDLEITNLAVNGYLTPSADLKIYLKGDAEPLTERVTTQKPLELQTEDGANYLELPTPVAYEFNNNAQYIICKYTIEPVDNKYKISINTPYEWLTDAKRTFPVVIDPTIRDDQHFINQPSEFQSKDTWIGDNGGALVDYSHGSDDNIYVGGANLDYRGLIQFDLSSLPDKDVPMRDAFLKLIPHTGATGYDNAPNREVSVHEVLEDWKEGTGKKDSPASDGATWNSNGFGSWTGGEFSINDENISLVGNSEVVNFSLPNLVPKWRNNPSSNYGLLIKYYQQASFPNIWKVFYSSSSEPSFRPKLDVIFDNKEPKASNINRIPWDEDTEDTTEIELNNIFTDGDGNDLIITIWNGTAWTNKFECDLFYANLTGNGIDIDWVCEFDLKHDQNGEQLVIFNCTDRIAYVESEITIDIEPVNDPPRLHPIGNQEALEEEFLYVDLQVTEAEGEKITWETNVTDYNNPETYMANLWLEADKKDITKAKLIYQPKNSDVPVVYINISARDGSHSPPLQPSIDWEHIKITIENVNDKPRFIKIADQIREDVMTIAATQETKLSKLIQAYDDDLINGDDLHFNSDSKKGDEGDNFTLENVTGTDIPLDYRAINTEVNRIEWTPKNKHVGVFYVNLTVNDNDKIQDNVTLIFNVKDVNDPPIIISTTISQPTSGAKHTNRDFINLSCDVDDPDLMIPDSNEKLNITWYSNISKLIGYGKEIMNVHLKAGYHQIELLVKDSAETEAKRYILLTVVKSITLQKYCEQSYQDDSDFDDTEYSYNDKSKEFTVSQGRNEEVDVINLTGTYDDGMLVIDLIFATDIELVKIFIIKIFLVTIEHEEPTQNYKVKYTSNFFQKGLYQPLENLTYGYFTHDDGTISANVFTIKYSLADLEAGTSRFEPLHPNFKIFATVKWSEVEYHKDYKVESYRYDSIGWISARAPIPADKSVKDDDTMDSGLTITIAALVIIVVIIWVLVFLILRKKHQKKSVIDFSSATTPYGQPRPDNVQQMFMSPFEQQFQKQPGAMGAPPMQPQQLQVQQPPPQTYSQPMGVGQQMPTTVPQQHTPLQPPSFSKPQLPATTQPTITPPGTSSGQMPPKKPQ